MAIYCPGCWKDVSTWSNNHTAGGSSGLGGAGHNDYDYTFCTSCWDAVENWFLNTNINEAIVVLCSACSGAGTNTHAPWCGMATSHAIPVSPVAEVVSYYANVSAGVAAG